MIIMIYPIKCRLRVPNIYMFLVFNARYLLTWGCCGKTPGNRHLGVGSDLKKV